MATLIHGGSGELFMRTDEGAVQNINSLEIGSNRFNRIMLTNYNITQQTQPIYTMGSYVPQGMACMGASVDITMTASLDMSELREEREIPLIQPQLQQVPNPLLANLDVSVPDGELDPKDISDIQKYLTTDPEDLEPKRVSRREAIQRNNKKSPNNNLSVDKKENEEH